VFPLFGGERTCRMRPVRHAYAPAIAVLVSSVCASRRLASKSTRSWMTRFAP